MKKIKNGAMKIDDSTKQKIVSIGKLIPSMITLMSFCFGLTAIKFALFYKWEMSVFCIFVSAILDACDGRVARMLGHSSVFGAELDSLSDLVCFGVAPGIIIFLRSGYCLENIGWGISLFYMVCCSLRLARFNAVEICAAGISEKNFSHSSCFTGIPAPMGALVTLLPLILYFQFDREFFISGYFVSAFVCISGILMVSTIKTFSMKMMTFNKDMSPLILLLISLIIIMFIINFWFMLSVLIIGYLLSIPCSSLCDCGCKIRNTETIEKIDTTNTIDVKDNSDTI